MRRTALVLAATLIAHAGLRAQDRRPRLVLAAGGGVTIGADLWHLPAQVDAAPNLLYDSMRFGRRISGSTMGFASITYFPGEHLGYTFELAYHGINSTGACAPLGPWAPDGQDKNAQACSGINNGRFRTSMMTVQAGLTLRGGTARAVVPYLRASAGIGLLDRSFVQSAALVNSSCGTCALVLVDERHRPSATWVATLAAGNAISTGQGYGFRIEVRDLIAALPVATDSGTPTYSAPYPYVKTGWRICHLPGLVIGAEVFLERGHRRRY